MDSSGESKVNYIQVPQFSSEAHELCPLCCFCSFLFSSLSLWLLVAQPRPLLLLSFSLCQYNPTIFPGESLSVPLSHWFMAVSEGRAKRNAGERQWTRRIVLIVISAGDKVNKAKSKKAQREYSKHGSNCFAIFSIIVNAKQSSHGCLSNGFNEAFSFRINCRSDFVTRHVTGLVKNKKASGMLRRCMVYQSLWPLKRSNCWRFWKDYFWC